MTQIDKLWLNINLATMEDSATPFGAVENGAIALSGDRIAWAGPAKDLPHDIEQSAQQVFDAEQRWMTPGLIDCHTHLVFGGDRANEFAMRLEGASYEEIARAGGGIRSTVAKTRAATQQQLVDSAAHRLRQFLAEGVTTVEIKSGYGLNLESESKMLSAARQLGADYQIDVLTTFLGAHALPPEYEGEPDRYIDLVCHEILPAIAARNLADAVDAFCEQIAFTPEQTERVFARAKALGLPVKLHADQLTDSGGAALAARYNALSADHIEYTSAAGVDALAAAGTTAVLLPGAFYCLREKQLPPIDLLRQQGVNIAIATDANPGSSPTCSLLLMLNMACTLFRLTTNEALAGITRNAAKALGLHDKGTLTAGKLADLVLWDINHPAELCYWLGANPCRTVVKSGELRDKPGTF